MSGISTLKENITKVNKKSLIYILLIIAAFVASYSYTFDKKLDVNGDNARYIELARNLASGHGYSTEGLDFAREPQTHFPPGYPVILSIPIILGLDNLILFKIMNGLFMIIAILLLYFVTEKASGSKEVAFTAATISACHNQLLKFATMAMSEMSFLFFMALAMFALTKMIDEKRKFGPWFFVAALSAAVCYYIRAAGSAIVFSILVFYLFRKEWKRAIISTAITAACVIPWSIRNKIVGVPRDYLFNILAKNPWRPEEGLISSFSEFWDKIWVNLNDTALSGFTWLLWPRMEYVDGVPSAKVAIIGFLIIAIIFFGLWNSGKMRWALCALLLANMGLVLIWNGGNNVRYVTPFVPVIIYGFINGVYSLIMLPFRKTKIKDCFVMRSLPYLGLILIVGIIPRLKHAHEVAEAKLTEPYAQYYAFATRIERMKRRDTRKPVVLCRKPELFKYYAPNCLPMFFASTPDDIEFLKHMVYNKADYVVFDCLGYSSTYRYLLPTIQKHMDLFKLVEEKTTDDASSALFIFERAKAEQYLRDNGYI